MSTIRSVDRAFEILQIVAQHPKGIGVNAIAAQMDLAKSTVSRLLSTMQNREVVERTIDKRYRIGAEPMRWLRYQPATTTLPALARPILQEIAAETGEAAAICVQSGREVIYLDNVQSKQEIQVRDWTNEKLPLHVVSPGKVLLAFADDAFIDTYLQEPLASVTPQTIIDPHLLREQLKTIRQEGYAVTIEEFAPEVIGLSVPLTNAGGRVVAALGVYGPKFRLGTATVQQKCVGSLKAGIQKILVP